MSLIRSDMIPGHEMITYSMPWHAAIIDEVMRVWPPVWGFMREVEKEDRIGDSIISPWPINNTTMKFRRRS